jgi:serine O-acetyltransferase
MRVLQEIVRDTLSIARTLHGRLGVREIAATVAHDGVQVLALWRVREAAARWHVPVVGGLARRLQVGLFGVEIARDVKLGEGVLFVHTVGIVIGGSSRVGDRVMFLGSNTLGSVKQDGFPQLGDGVIVGAGARILGPVSVGERASVGANAVVLRDVPPSAAAIGVPAVVRTHDERRPAGDGRGAG